MWIFSRVGFFSVVEDREDPRRRTILVRARVRAHLVAALALVPDDLTIHATPARDYAFRAKLTRPQWRRLAARLADGVTYSNFKGELATSRALPEYQEAAHRVWELLLNALQGPRAW